MQQAEQTNIILGPWAHSLRKLTPIEQLWKQYQVTASEKRRIYALADQPVDGDLEAAEAACDAAYEALEAIADAILTAPLASEADATIQAQVLLARGADPADLLHYRPQDLTRFVREVGALAKL
ncbi:hypothetical protein XI09_40995 [Bradyrhizobium sp. CCBAU 11386]|uniref:hypothetical protein n=1 Tax=Bradyrhizobium sp. CCBAU 11386 TaxID=1630837 RepID=UPI00230393D6|nr:hypothetical protein [Bradyrhizobium sp. CCBAU 11386]MDA9510928.1 hypothetical protein [Bradyrhizobium sp. CCBAU 11386]